MIISYRRLGLCGRLGNQLWQIAGTLGVAEMLRRNGLPVNVSFPKWDYQQFFQIPSDLFTALMGNDPMGYVKHLHPRTAEYLQDYGLFREIEPTIRQYFAPSQAANAVLFNERNEWFHALPKPRVSVHVRRGDNLDPASHAPGWFPINSADYFAKAAKSFEGARSVVVFSDGLDWCKEAIGPLLKDLPVFYYPGTPRPDDIRAYFQSPCLDWIDLLLMSLCEHHVLSSSSSYSWWGAFLSEDKHPVHPHVWFGDILGAMSNWRLMIPEGWVEMRDDGALNVSAE